MIRKIRNKFVNKETISYVIFGVLTTALDWIVYTVMREYSIDYRLATAASWCAAVLFAFITNKLYVFKSYDFRQGHLLGEFFSFVACRACTGVFTLFSMIVFVDYMGMNDYIGKLINAVVVLILNYIFSKIFIFKQKACKER